MPVVSFIVRSVDELLKTRFNLPRGLADTSRLPDGTHKVLVLDPAVGTATFLYAVIDLIRDEFMQRDDAGMWSGYVRDHLLDRIFGFEIMMAPYAVAHFKLALQLAGHDLDMPEEQRARWAYDFQADDRIQVYLTNTLEILSEDVPGLYGPMQFVSTEAKAADAVKQEKPIMVVLGNPPYSVSSANKSEFIENLMDTYKEAVRDERNIQPLSDDYIKFIRFAHDRIERTGSGIVAMITNNSYLSGLIHRGMREELQKTFNEIYILNLHGNSIIGELSPSGDPDENVFDIRQGVVISIFVSTLPIKCLYKKQENQAISKARDGIITISRNLRAMRVTWRPNSVR
jgi:predicted helicase